MNGLLGDAEPGGDVLPRPSQFPRVVDLEDLQTFRDYPQGGHRPQPDVRVVVGRALGDLECALHARQHMLTSFPASTYADAGRSGRVALSYNTTYLICGCTGEGWMAWRTGTRLGRWAGRRRRCSRSRCSPCCWSRPSPWRFSSA